jgi:hypothetical protein
MRRVLVASAVMTLTGASGWFASAAAHGSGAVLEARVGDTVQVVGAPLGCRVLRERELGGRITIDCRKAGALAGTYGTLMTAREAVLIRFVSNRRAKRVAMAVHGSAARRCR